VVIGIPLPLGGIGIAEKTESPQILWNLRAPCDAGPVSRILYGVAAADGHSSRPAITGRLKRPTRKLGAPGQHAWDVFSRAPQRLSPASPSRPARAIRLSPSAHPAIPFLPYLVLLRVGFAMPRSLLAGRCALTAPFHPYPDRSRGGMFSVALSVERA